MGGENLLPEAADEASLEVDGVTVDADVMSSFVREMRQGGGEVFELLERIAVEIGIATSEIMKAEWLATAGSYEFKQWLASKIPVNQVRFVKRPWFPHAEMKRLHIDFGLPRSGRDKELIRIAHATALRYILTIDADLFDPKVKRGSLAEKARACDDRRGKLCRYLWKSHKIQVGRPHHCIADLFASFSPAAEPDN